MKIILNSRLDFSFPALLYKPSLHPQLAVSLETIREVCFVMVSQYVQIQDRRHATVAAYV